MESKRTVQTVNERKTWLFERINKIDILLPKLSKRKTKRHKLIKIEGKKSDIITDSTEILRITRQYVEILYSNKLENQEEIDCN
jgi:hypothetical protein